MPCYLLLGGRTSIFVPSLGYSAQRHLLFLKLDIKRKAVDRKVLSPQLNFMKGDGNEFSEAGSCEWGLLRARENA